jgi:hypothetical protein
MQFRKGTKARSRTRALSGNASCHGGTESTEESTEGLVATPSPCALRFSVAKAISRGATNVGVDLDIFESASKRGKPGNEG